jgi:poly(A) polymerase
MIHAALSDTDRRVNEHKSVAPSFLLACVLWQDVRHSWEGRMANGQPMYPALQEAIDEVFDARIGDISGRGKLGADMREIWSLQPRFEKRLGQSPWGLVQQARFRAAFDFMRLRAATQEIDQELGEWWAQFSEASDEERDEMLEHYRVEHQRQSSSRAKATRSKPVTQSQDKQILDEGESKESLDEGSAKTAPKRRRRRKPKGSEPISPT